MIGNGRNQVVVSRQRYYPFGGVRTETGADITSRGYTGHVENRGIGLTYMNARFYASGASRFITADTIVPEPENPQSWNRYSYVHNNPILHTDPTGHCPAILCGAAIGAAIGGGINYYQQFQQNRSEGMSMRDAANVNNIDWGKVAGSATTGAIVGGSFSLVGAGAGVVTFVAVGATSNLIGNQVGAIAEEIVDDQIYSDDSHFNQSAEERGFGYAGHMAVDAVMGGAAGLLSYGVSAAGTELGRVTKFLPEEDAYTMMGPGGPFNPSSTAYTKEWTVATSKSIPANPRVDWWYRSTLKIGTNLGVTSTKSSVTRSFDQALLNSNRADD